MDGLVGLDDFIPVVSSFVPVRQLPLNEGVESPCLVGKIRFIVQTHLSSYALPFTQSNSVLDSFDISACVKPWKGCELLFISLPFNESSFTWFGILPYTVEKVQLGNGAGLPIDSASPTLLHKRKRDFGLAETTTKVAKNTEQHKIPLQELDHSPVDVLVSCSSENMESFSIFLKDGIVLYFQVQGQYALGEKVKQLYADKKNIENSLGVSFIGEQEHQMDLEVIVEEKQKLLSQMKDISYFPSYMKVKSLIQQFLLVRNSTCSEFAVSIQNKRVKLEQELETLKATLLSKVSCPHQTNIHSIQKYTTIENKLFSNYEDEIRLNLHALSSFGEQKTKASQD